MRVAVVTPWLNHRELLPGYTAAIKDAGDIAKLHLWIIDNGSAPPLDFARVRLDENAGFAAASNLGMREADTDAVLFLNNDIEATSRGWLDRIVAALEPGVLVGAKLRYDRHASVDGEPLPYLDGWCLAGIRADLVDLGGFDESFAEPSYYGDNDLCLRARAAGMRLREVRVGLRHLENVTAGPGWDPAAQAASDANRARYVERVRELMAVAA